MIARSALAAAAAAVIAAGALGEAAEAQWRRGLAEGGGVTVTVGKSRARSCYEEALARSGSDRAIEICDLAMRGSLSGRDRFATHVNRAIVLVERGELAAATEDLEAALARRPEHPIPHVNLGDVYLRSGRWAEAEAALTRALALEPPAPQRVHFARAIAREEAGDLAGAYADYRKAAELAPGWDLPRLELERFSVTTEGASGGA